MLLHIATFLQYFYGSVLWHSDFITFGPKYAIDSMLIISESAYVSSSRNFACEFLKFA